MSEVRVAEVKRKTNETDVFLRLNLDGKGEYQINSGVGFIDHCLSQWSKHGAFDLELNAKGDLEVDAHHTVEDIGICLGKALRKAREVKETKGITGKNFAYKRFGQALVPMDEALVMVAVDLSGRSYLAYEVVVAPKVGNFDTELVEEFLRALTTQGEFTLHVRLLAGRNTHHCLEAVFKALGRAMREALSRDERIQGVPSTRGVIS